MTSFAQILPQHFGYVAAVATLTGKIELSPHRFSHVFNLSTSHRTFTDMAVYHVW